MANFLALFDNHLNGLKMLNDEQAGKAIKAIAAYYSGEEPQVTDPAVFAFLAATNIFATIDRGRKMNKEREKERSKEKDKEKHITQITHKHKKEIKEIYKEKKKKETGTDEPDNRPLRDGDNPLARVRVLC